MLIVLGAVENLFFIAPNVPQLAEVRDYEEQILNLTTKL
jgi:hypothetical protein